MRTLLKKVSSQFKLEVTTLYLDLRMLEMTKRVLPIFGNVSI